LGQCDFVVGDIFELTMFWKELAQQIIEVFVWRTNSHAATGTRRALAALS